MATIGPIQIHNLQNASYDARALWYSTKHEIPSVHKNSPVVIAQCPLSSTHNLARQVSCLYIGLSHSLRLQWQRSRLSATTNTSHVPTTPLLQLPCRQITYGAARTFLIIRYLLPFAVMVSLPSPMQHTSCPRFSHIGKVGAVPPPCRRLGIVQQLCTYVRWIFTWQLCTATKTCPHFLAPY